MRSRLLRPAGAFTIVEVMVSATVLLFGVVSAVTVSQRGLQALDAARNLGAASQAMQSEMERLRLMSWTQLDALQHSGEQAVEVSGLAARASRLTCSRTIADVKADMKEITLTAEWRGYDGTPHRARLITRYGQSGLNDYFYTTH